MENNILIAYYSHSGNTEKIAKLIQKIAGGDFVKIEPVKDYSREYNAVLAEAKQEINENIMPAIKANDVDLSKYDKVYVGTPNWWSTMAPPIKTFLSNNDFTGKKLSPFCTHGGGGKGTIFDDMAKACNSPIEDGLEIYSDGGVEAEKLILNWIK